MIPENYLEYLALNTILNDYMDARELTKGRPDVCIAWLANNTHVYIKLNKLKERISSLQKDLLKDYICTDNTLKKD